MGPSPPPPGTNGFAYAEFRNTATNDIVISFRGTDNDLADWTTNLGISLSQEKQAAAQFARILRDYGTDAQGNDLDNISFTGHSLGGGLAARAGGTLTDDLRSTSTSIAACGRRVRFAGLFGFKFGAFEDQKRRQRWRRGRADAQVGRRPSLRPFMHDMRVTRSSGARSPRYQPAGKSGGNRGREIGVRLQFPWPKVQQQKNRSTRMLRFS